MQGVKRKPIDTKKVSNAQHRIKQALDRPDSQPAVTKSDSFWEPACESLMAHSFQSESEALNSVVTTVIQTLEGSDAEDPQLKDFLRTMLETDLELRGEIADILNVNKA